MYTSEEVVEALSHTPDNSNVRIVIESVVLGTLSCNIDNIVYDKMSNEVQIIGKVGM